MDCKVVEEIDKIVSHGYIVNNVEDDKGEIDFLVFDYEKVMVYLKVNLIIVVIEVNMNEEV